MNKIPENFLEIASILLKGLFNCVVIVTATYVVLHFVVKYW